MKFNHYKVGIFSLITFIILLSCSKTDDPTPEPTKKITSISIDASNFELSLGESTTLSVKHTPSDIAAPVYKWSSSDETVATVTDGKINALKIGEATITAEVASTQLKSQIIVKVIPVSANSLVLTSDKNTIDIGEKTVIAYEILPLNTTDKNNLVIEWTTDKPAIATVTNGEVTGIAVGTAEITAKIKNTDVTGKFNITVKAISVSSISLDQQSGSLNIGSEKTIRATILPANATNKNINWSSSDSNVATVSAAGIIQAKNTGTANITATTEDGNKTATFKVTVTPISVTSVSLPQSQGTLEINQTAQLTPTVLPANASNKNVKWTSSDATVVSVSSAGVLKALKSGSATITVETTDGNKTATYKVTVPEIVAQSVTLTSSSNTLEIGKTLQLTYNILPANTNNKTLTWASSNSNIATISSTGLITGKAAGNVTITVTSSNGKKGTYTVQITPVQISKITLSKTSVVLPTSVNYDLTVSLTPSNADVNNLEWSSSDNNVATVDIHGRVRTVGVGKAVISVKADKNSTIVAQCAVEVKSLASLVELKQTQSTIHLISVNITDLTSKVDVINNSDSEIQFLKFEVKDANGTLKGLYESTRNIGAGSKLELDHRLSNWNSTTHMYVTVKAGSVQEILKVELKNLGRN